MSRETTGPPPCCALCVQYDPSDFAMGISYESSVDLFIAGFAQVFIGGFIVL